MFRHIRRWHIRDQSSLEKYPDAYPAAELDMFYCTPALSLQTGAGIPQTEYQQPIFGEVFQRWSHHRASQVWSPTGDSVVTHLGGRNRCSVRWSNDATCKSVAVWTAARYCQGTSFSWRRKGGCGNIAVLAHRRDSP
ncbi:E2/UBC family protein [Duganella rhizosphaerae]|uniref:E2/UBC family protein n=1 Tax=Duganella rhizosphaerae TaxID=2885763 RepID=UPI00403FA5E9